jgi:hypothetical protein
MVYAFNPFFDSAPALASFMEATEYLEKCCDGLGAQHLSYWSVRLLDGLPDDVSWIATYPPDYMAHYMSRYTPADDPIFTDALLRRFCIDWKELNSGQTARTIHSEAERHGISTHGMSFPFHTGLDGLILFSATVVCGEADWPRRRVEVAAPLHAFAHYFHQRAEPLVTASRRSMVAVAA